MIQYSVKLKLDTLVHSSVLSKNYHWIRSLMIQYSVKLSLDTLVHSSVLSKTITGYARS